MVFFCCCILFWIRLANKSIKKGSKHETRNRIDKARKKNNDWNIVNWNNARTLNKQAVEKLMLLMEATEFTDALHISLEISLFFDISVLRVCHFYCRFVDFNRKFVVLFNRKDSQQSKCTYDYVRNSAKQPTFLMVWLLLPCHVHQYRMK